MKIIYTAIISILLISTSSLLNAQEEKDINADRHFFWSEYDKPEWDVFTEYVDKINYFRFYNFNGAMYSVQTHQGKTHLYKFNHHDNRFANRYIIHEGNSGADYIPIYNPLMFEYAGHVYLFEYGYQKASESHRFVQHHTKHIDEHKEWHKDKDYSGNSHDFRIYRDACTIGDYVYLIYDSFVEGDDIHHVTDGHEIRIAKCTMDENHKLVQHKLYKLTDVMEKKSQHPYAATWFIHPDGDPRILISFSAEHTTDKENKGGGVIVFKPSNGTHKRIFYENDYAFSIRAIHGSMQGKRANPPGNKSDGDRIQILYNHFEDGHWVNDDLIHHHWVGDRGAFKYKTYTIEGNDYNKIGEGEIFLGAKDRHPDEWNRMSMELTYMLETATDDTEVSTSTSAETKYHQKLWMFYTDKDGYIRGCKFNSDTWRYIPDTYRFSYDLDDTDTYGEEVKDSWILLGIIEGAPPAPINWEIWDDFYFTTEEPSEFSYERETSDETSIESITKGSVFVGFKAGGEEAPIEVEGKYTSTWTKEKENSTIEIAGEISSLGLNKESQKLGSKFFLVPQIERLTYGVFPWWRSDNEINLNHATNYQYRFITLKYTIKREDISLDDPLFALDLDSINTETLWSWTKNNENRLWLLNNANKANILNIYWKDPFKGTESYFEKETEEWITRTHENEIELSAAAGKPMVFKVTGGGSYSWENSVTIKTKLSNRFSFSYENLISKEHGPKVKEIDTKAFLFEEPNGLYFEQYLKEGQQPWYIGYVASVTPKEENVNAQSLVTNILFNEDVKDNDFKVYPNPSNGKQINIATNNTTEGTYSIKIFSASGVEVHNEITYISENRNTYNLKFAKTLNNGLYFIQIVGEEGKIYKPKKLIVTCSE